MPNRENIADLRHIDLHEIANSRPLIRAEKSIYR